MELRVHPKTKLTPMMHDPTRRVDEGKPKGLPSLGHEAFAQYQPLQERLKVQRQDHDRPPGRVCTQLGRRELPARKVLLQDRMCFLTLATAFLVPTDQIGSGITASVGYQRMDFVGHSRERDRRKGETLGCARLLGGNVEVQQAPRVAQPFTHNPVAKRLEDIAEQSVFIGYEHDFRPFPARLLLFTTLYTVRRRPVGPRSDRIAQRLGDGQRRNSP